MNPIPALEELARKYALETANMFTGWAFMTKAEKHELASVFLRFASAHTELMKQELAPVREALKAASQVGEIRFKSCVLSAQVASQIESALRTLENLGDGPKP